MLGATGAFFALQLLPHHITSLHNGPFVFVFFYPLLALLIGLIIVIGGVISFLMWMLTRDDVSKRKHCNWCATFALMFMIATGLTLCSIAYARGLPTGSFSKPFNKQLWAAPTS